MNVELEHLERLDKLSSIIKRLTGGIALNLEISKEIRLLLIEADEMTAVDSLSDILIHLEASVEILNKIRFNGTDKK